MTTSFGFVGCGTMGSALATSFARDFGPSCVFVADRSEEKTDALSKKNGCIVCTAQEIAGKCDFIFLCVQLQKLDTLSAEIKNVLSTRKKPFILVSAVTGASFARLHALFGEYPMIRTVPNLPVSIGAGVVAYLADGVDVEKLSLFTDCMSCTGMLRPMRSEHQLDAAYALSGCAPAFTGMFLEALADAGVKCDLKRADAQEMAAQALLGSARLLLEDGLHPGTLKDLTCTSGDAAITGVFALEKETFRQKAFDAVISVYEKTGELSE